MWKNTVWDKFECLWGWYNPVKARWENCKWEKMRSETETQFYLFDSTVHSGCHIHFVFSNCDCPFMQEDYIHFLNTWSIKVLWLAFSKCCWVQKRIESSPTAHYLWKVCDTCFFFLLLHCVHITSLSQDYKQWEVGILFDSCIFINLEPSIAHKLDVTHSYDHEVPYTTHTKFIKQ